MDTNKKLFVIPAILILTFVGIFAVMAILTADINNAAQQENAPNAFKTLREQMDNAIVALSVIVMLSLVGVLIMSYMVVWSLAEEHRKVQKAKSQFFSMITHELRSPITPIKAELQMLLEGYNGKLTPKQRKSLQVVLRNSTRLDALIGDLIDATKLQSSQLRMEFKKTDLHKEIKEIVNDMRHVLPEKNVDVTLDADALPQLNVDPDRLMQVLRNILHNAKKYSPPKSTIHVSVKKDDLFAQFSVKDQGRGISKEMQAHVFEPFFQGAPEVSKQYGGTGLGLVICRGIVEVHGGKMWFESEEGKGTTFHFTVPLHR